MFVQYSFVQRREAPLSALWRSTQPSEPLVMSLGIAFMAVTSLCYALATA